VRRYVIAGIVAAVIGAGLWAVIRFGGELSFYARLYQASRVGRRFYAQYEHLAKDVVYDPQVKPRLDVYSPAEGSGHPVLVFFHGGGWYQFDKVLYGPVAMKLLPFDIVVVMVDYSLYPAADCRQMAHEAAAAVAWTLEHIGEYGGDPARVVVGGQSAGAQLAALAAMDPQYLAAYGHSSGEIRGLIGVSGVYDIAAEDAYLRSGGQRTVVLQKVMGGAANYAALSPLSYVRADLPPVLLVHGDKDTTVPVELSAAFQQSLQAAGVQSELVIYPGHNHAELLFYALTDPKEELVKTIAAWVQQHTQ
jgi:acetyl esterase/lipase